MDKHTEGLWIIDAGEGDIPHGYLTTVVRNNETDHPQGPFVIAHINDSRGDESKANARLIAAAPKLLRCVKELCEEMIVSNPRQSQWTPGMESMLKRSESAIAEAEPYTQQGERPHGEAGG